MNALKISGFIFFKIGVLIMFLNSMYPWVTWNLGILLPLILSVLFSIPFLGMNSASPYLGVNRKGKRLIVLYLILMSIWESLQLSIFGIAFRILYCIPFFAMFSFKEEYKCEIVDFITKWFARLLAISLVFYILIKIGINLPYSYISFSSEDSYDTFYNYYFCIIKPLSFRFQSIFLEPGHMTMGIAPLLFLKEYNLKDKNVLILFLAQLFSLSLAGYIVMIIGYIITLFLRKDEFKSKIKYLVGIAITLVLFSYAIPRMTGMDDIWDVAMISRLEDYSENGYRRNSEDFDVVYDRISKTSTIITGTQKNTDDYGGAGFKKYIVSYGIIGVFLVVMLYCSPCFMYKKRKRVISLSLILLILLFQNSYPSWFCALSCLILGSAYLNRSEELCLTE